MLSATDIHSAKRRRIAIALSILLGTSAASACAGLLDGGAMPREVLGASAAQANTTTAAALAESRRLADTLLLAIAEGRHQPVVVLTWESARPQVAPLALDAPLPPPPSRLPSTPMPELRYTASGSPFAEAFDTSSRVSASVADRVALGQSDLLFAGYQRPGLAATLSPAAGYQMTLFSAEAAPSRRYYGNGQVSALPSERSRGIRASTQLADNMQLTTGYLTGETTFMGPDAVLARDPRLHGGDGWNVAFDSRWLEDAMRVYLEYAESTFDRDGYDYGNEAEQGVASQLGIKLASGKALGAGPFDYWAGDFRYRAADRRFFSVGNPGLPADVEALGSWFQFGLGSIAGRFEWRSEVNNLDHNPSRVTRALEHSGLELTYTPLWAHGDNWLWQRIGAPSLVTEIGQTRRQRRTARLVKPAAYSTLREADQLRTVLRFSRPSWRWSARYQLIDETGFLGGSSLSGEPVGSAPPDKQREVAGLKLGIDPTARTSFDVSILWNTRQDSDGWNEQDDRHWSVGATTELVPDRLSLQLRYQQGRDFETLGDISLLDDPFEVGSGYVQIAWHALQAGAERPAIDFFVQGQRDKQENRVNDYLFEQWSVHLGVKISWQSDTK